VTLEEGSTTTLVQLLWMLVELLDLLTTPSTESLRGHIRSYKGLPWDVQGLWCNELLDLNPLHSNSLDLLSLSQALEQTHSLLPDHNLLDLLNLLHSMASKGNAWQQAQGQY
jgi:hypothetical protein